MRTNIPITFVEPIPRLALTKKEAAKALGVSVQTIWRLTATGKLPKTTYGVFPISAIEEHLRQEVGLKQVSPQGL